MSKSGLFAHFGSKEELQVSTVRAAAAIFAHRVVMPAEERFEPGIRRLQGMLDLWLDYMERGIFDGGCFFAAATMEMDGRPGPVRDAIAEQMRLWGGHLADLARDAMARGELLERHRPAPARVRARRARDRGELRLAAARGRRRLRARPPRDPAPARSGRHRARPRRARRAGRLIGPGTHEGPA